MKTTAKSRKRVGWYALLACCLAAGALCAGASAAQELPEVEVVDYVDVEQFMGLWYEIANIPNEDQDLCAGGGTTATYTLLDDGSVEVVNRCYGERGFPWRVKGRAFVADPETNAKLRVSFTCLGARCLFFGDYWVIGLGSEYEYAVVGHPTRNFGWILSRECEISDDVLAQIQQVLEDQYYDFADFVMTDQSRNGCAMDE